MDGRMILRRILIAAGLLLAMALLSTCSNQFSLLGTLTDEVKVATGKFLVVNSVIPAKSASDFNPGAPIIIEFDRAINEDTVTMSTVQFTPSEGFTFGPQDVEFIAPSRALYINPNPGLKGLVNYTVTIGKGVKGTDGSELQNEFSWSFTTLNLPAGSVRIDVDGDITSIDTYVLNEDPVTLVLGRTSTSVTGVGIGLTEEAAILAADTPGAFADTKTFTLATGEGVKDVYAVFVDNAVPVSNKSLPEHATIVRDLYVPNVTIVTPPLNVTASSAASQALDASADDGTGSGIGTVSWSATLSSGTGSLSFSDPAVLDTSVYDPSGTSDGTFELRVTVTDKALRTNSAVINANWDRTCPSAPVVTGTGNKVDPELPTWNWTCDAADLAKYQVSWDGASWTDNAMTASYTGAQAYGPNTLYVRAVDDAGNSSSNGSTTPIYYSPNDIYPYWGQIILFSGLTLPITMQWPDYPKAADYDLYIWRDKDAEPTKPTYPELTISEQAVTLQTGYQYYWYYKAYYSLPIYPPKRILVFTSPKYFFNIRRMIIF